MTTITFTDLQLRVTLAQWRKAQMPQWGERDWKMHLHDECVRYLNGNGKARVFGVTIEDLADRGMTKWDKAGVATASVAVIATGSKEPLPVASAAPADPEWPKWFLNGGAPHCTGVPWEAVRHDEPGDGGYWYSRDGTSGFAVIYDDKDVNYREIPRPEALKWLRANGHAKVAEELERQAAPADPYEPVGTMPVVGDRIVVRDHVKPGYHMPTVGTKEVGNIVVAVKALPGQNAVVTDGGAECWRTDSHPDWFRIIKRQAAPAPATVPAAAGLQVWQLANILTVYGADGRSVAAWCGGKWVADKGFTKYPGETRLPAAEEAREIEAAREAGVL